MADEYPLNVNTEGWDKFNPENPIDAICERERQEFTAFVMQQLKSAPLRGSDSGSISVGMSMALVQLMFSMVENKPSEDQRQALHQVIDFCWVQCEAMQATDRPTQ